MRLRHMVLALAVAFSARNAEAQADKNLQKNLPHNIGHSYPLAPPRSVNNGAVYEIKLRVPYKDVGDYLAEYARWYLPVDQYLCDTSQDADCSSGRKLLSVLAREHGDHYNLVVLYWYESAYKQNYYCKYRKAFFQYHTKANATELIKQYYGPALKEWGVNIQLMSEQQQKARLAQTLGALTANCTYKSEDQQQEAAIAEETLHKIDLKLASMVDLDEGSWNFEISLCKLTKLRNKESITDEELDKPCPDNRKSMLERAVRELKWEPEKDQK